MPLSCPGPTSAALTLYVNSPAAEVSAVWASRTPSGKSLRVRVLSSVEGLEPSFQIGLEILDILQPDVEPQCRTTRRPFGGRAVGRAVKWNDEAFEAAP